MPRKRKSVVQEAHARMRELPEDTSLEALVGRHEDAVYGPTLALVITTLFAVPMWGWLGAGGLTGFRFEALTLLALPPVPFLAAWAVSARSTRAARHHLVVGSAHQAHAKVLDASTRADALEPTPEVLELRALAQEVSSAFVTTAPDLRTTELEARRAGDTALLVEVARQRAELDGAANDLLAACEELESAQCQRRMLERVAPDLDVHASTISSVRALTRTGLDQARDANRVIEASLLEVQRASSPGALRTEDLRG